MDQPKQIAPKLPRKRTMNKEMVIRFRVGETNERRVGVRGGGGEG